MMAAKRYGWDGKPFREIVKNKNLGRPLQKYPRMTITSCNKGCLNTAATELLTQDGEAFVALRRLDSDTIELRPLALPPGTLTVVQIRGGRFVQLYRVKSITKKGDAFDCDWVDGDGVMVCRRKK